MMIYSRVQTFETHGESRKYLMTYDQLIKFFLISCKFKILKSTNEKAKFSSVCRYENKDHYIKILRFVSNNAIG